MKPIKESTRIKLKLNGQVHYFFPLVTFDEGLFNVLIFTNKLLNGYTIELWIWSNCWKIICSVILLFLIFKIKYKFNPLESSKIIGTLPNQQTYLGFPSWDKDWLKNKPWLSYLM